MPGNLSYRLICCEEPFNYKVNNGRVIGGNDAQPNTWKWQYRVVVGEYNLFQYEGSEQFISVETIIVHPDWNKNLADGNDIALLKLVKPIYGNGYVEIANLPYPEQTLPHGFTCYITGWGLMDNYGNVPDKLQEAPLDVVEHAVCSQPEWWGSVALKTMVCAGGDGVISGCQGDSGGPLNCLTNGVWRVHGIVSYGPAGMCNQQFKPTVFTRVSSFVSWIFSVRNLKPPELTDMYPD
ncbi:hypothetical protein GOODEAATRI_006563 [Goodea atripinnis]|uniref:Peptidase S1 domain-containing protein n=1 Tax=Goodea atripinnis TaxID=208336 RepID=A0ABV0MZA9_9TELE